MAGEWVNALMSAPNPGAMAAQGFNNGMQLAQQQEQVRQQQEDRKLAMQDRERQARTQQLSEAREQLTIMSRLLEGATDPVSYENARQNAQALGLDVSKVPPQFNPNWIAQTKQQAQALLGTVEQELMAVAPGTTVIDKRTGQKVYENPRPPRYIPVQAGGKLVLDPSSVNPGAAMPPTAGDDEWEIIDDGGQTAPPSGGFPY